MGWPGKKEIGEIEFSDLQTKSSRDIPSSWKFPLNFAKYFQCNHALHKPGTPGIIPTHKLPESTDRGFAVSLAFPSPVKPHTSYTDITLLFLLFVALAPGQVWRRCRRRQQNSCRGTWEQHQELPLALSSLFTRVSLRIALKKVVFTHILVTKNSFIFNFLSRMKGDQIQIATMNFQSI